MTTSRLVGMRTINARVLTQESFAKYGDVIEHRGEARRRYIPSVYEHSDDVERGQFWVSRVEAAIAWPCAIRYLERHKYSSQTFIPLSRTAYIVVVAPSLADGQPDAEGIEAFVATASQGVCYRRGVWHHGLTVLEAPAEFAIFMGVTGKDDDEFLNLPESDYVSIVLPE